MSCSDHVFEFLDECSLFAVLVQSESRRIADEEDHKR
jgi:hypothetical protein